MTEESPGTASFDSRDAQRLEGRETSENSKLLGNHTILGSLNATPQRWEGREMNHFCCFHTRHLGAAAFLI